MNDEQKLKKALAPKSDQLNADDLIGSTLTIKVKRIVIKDSDQQPIEIYYEGDNGKPYKPCKSMGRVLKHVWGGPANWIGRSMTLFRDDKVTWAGMEIGGIRISHVSDINEKITLSLTASKSNRKPWVINPLAVSSQKKVETDPAVILAGQDVALKGVAAYTTWLASLTPAIKETIKPHHKDLSARAKKADEEAKKTEEEIPFDEVGGEEEIP